MSKIEDSVRIKMPPETTQTCYIKKATKSYFIHYSCVVMVVFNTALCSSAFSTVSSGKLAFRLSVLSVFFILKCFKSIH